MEMRIDKYNASFNALSPRQKQFFTSFARLAKYQAMH